MDSVMVAMMQATLLPMLPVAGGAVFAFAGVLFIYRKFRDIF